MNYLLFLIVGVVVVFLVSRVVVCCAVCLFVDAVDVGLLAADIEVGCLIGFAVRFPYWWKEVMSDVSCRVDWRSDSCFCVPRDIIVSDLVVDHVLRARYVPFTVC